MPKAACPACAIDVKYPRDAEMGTKVTCPECDEVFVPPALKIKEKKPKAYDPEEEETYRAERPPDDPDAEDKSRYVDAVARVAAAEERARKRPRKKKWHEGPEIWLLIFGVGSLGGFPFGFWLARNWEQMGPQKFFWLMCVLVFVGIAAVAMGMGSWNWLRKNRE